MNDNPKTKQQNEDSKTRKKTKSRKLYWILTVLITLSVIIVIISAMLFHRPRYYNPLEVADKGVMSVYLTNHLLPDFYNGVQYQEPFDLTVTQKGINDIVAHYRWPQKFGSIDVSDPVIFFTPDTLVLMMTVFIEGTELIATVIAEPEIDADGLLNLRVSAIKLGAMDVTLITKILAGDLYHGNSSDKDQFWEKAVCSMLYDEPFDHAFEIEDKKVHISKVTLEPQKLTLRFTPVFD